MIYICAFDTEEMFLQIKLLAVRSHVTCFMYSRLADLKDFKKVNEIYAKCESYHLEAFLFHLIVSDHMVLAHFSSSIIKLFFVS